MRYFYSNPFRFWVNEYEGEIATLVCRFMPHCMSAGRSVAAAAARHLGALSILDQHKEKWYETEAVLRRLRLRPSRAGAAEGWEVL